MVRGMEELLSAFRDITGESTDDRAIGFVEDLTDTISDYDSRTKDATDWKSKYEENDAAWRKKYTDRFYNPQAADPGTNNQIDTLTDSGTDTAAEESGVSGNYDDLFKTDTSTWR